MKYEHHVADLIDSLLICQEGLFSSFECDHLVNSENSTLLPIRVLIDIIPEVEQYSISQDYITFVTNTGTVMIFLLFQIP